MADQDYKAGTIRRKYDIRKADGSPVDPTAEYFVLRIDRDENDEPRDPHAHAALHAYADSVEVENPEFANDLRYWLEWGLRGFTDDALDEMGFTD